MQGTNLSNNGRKHHFFSQSPKRKLLLREFAMWFCSTGDPFNIQFCWTLNTKIANVFNKILQLRFILSIPQCARGRSLSDPSRNVLYYNVSQQTKLVEESKKESDVKLNRAKKSGQDIQFWLVLYFNLFDLRKFYGYE